MKHTIESNIWVCYQSRLFLIPTHKHRDWAFACLHHIFLQNRIKQTKQKTQLNNQKKSHIQPKTQQIYNKETTSTTTKEKK